MILRPNIFSRFLLTNSAAGKKDMKKGNLIPLDRSGRLLKKASAFITDLEGFLSDTSGAVKVLLDSLPVADTELILKIIPLLGCAGKDQVLEPLFSLMTAPSSDEQVRRSAAVHLGLAASLSEDPSALKDKLIDNLDHPEPVVRSGSALALGWEGNWPAVDPLITHLSDPDRDVQAAVVAALSSVGDSRVFDILLARLENGTMEQQRSILLNLWRFAERVPHVEDVYVGCMKTIPQELVVDALSGIAVIPLSGTILGVYRQFLADGNPRIRRQILENLYTENPADYDPLKTILHGLLDDKDPRVRQAAIRLFAKG
jgi:HEAT repeat protein